VKFTRNPEAALPPWPDCGACREPDHSWLFHDGPAGDVRAAPQLIDFVQGIRVTRDVGAGVRVAPCRCTSLRTRQRSRVRAYLMPHSSFAMPRASFAVPNPTLAVPRKSFAICAGTSKYCALRRSRNHRAIQHACVSNTHASAQN